MLQFQLQHIFPFMISSKPLQPFRRNIVTWQDHLGSSACRWCGSENTAHFIGAGANTTLPGSEIRSSRAYGFSIRPKDPPTSNVKIPLSRTVGRHIFLSSHFVGRCKRHVSFYKATGLPLQAEGTFNQIRVAQTSIPHHLLTEG